MPLTKPRQTSIPHPKNKTNKVVGVIVWPEARSGLTGVDQVESPPRTTKRLQQARKRIQVRPKQTFLSRKPKEIPVMNKQIVPVGGALQSHYQAWMTHNRQSMGSPVSPRTSSGVEQMHPSSVSSHPTEEGELGGGGTIGHRIC